jgi:predicted phage gp36 major capsid-like protein
LEIKLSLKQHQMELLHYILQHVRCTTISSAKKLIVAITAAAEHLHTAQWLINSDTGGMLVKMKDGNGDTPAHDAADSG